MSLAESGHSSRAVSLADLLAGSVPTATDPGLDIHDIVERMSSAAGQPAAPRAARRAPGDAMLATEGYLDETCRIDLRRLEGPQRDPENVARVLRSLTRTPPPRSPRGQRSRYRRSGGPDRLPHGD